MFIRNKIIGPILVLVVLGLVFSVDAQTKRRKAPAKKVAAVAVEPTPSPVVADPVVTKVEPKKNERPVTNAADADAKPSTTTAATNGATYFYEFKQPEFDISRIVIEHDDSGRGTIQFTKKMFGDSETDPVLVSPAALERIRAAYTALNFIDSRDSYQYEKDYSHLGTMTFGLKKSGKHRMAGFNYTTNKEAQALVSEYRKLSNQYLWIFDISVARENQPLESPRLLDSLDGFLKRNEISDPAQMVPLLDQLTNDERIPLIARNHARKLAEKIGKDKK